MGKSNKRLASDFEKRVWGATQKIPSGKVATYTDIARMLKLPRAARAIGSALNKNPFAAVPCHRVVRSDGIVGGYARGNVEKIRKLRREGIVIKGGKINLVMFRVWL
ncbi:MAG: MGMT family protein [bacterium]|nr:MGMT family protein [bacterium]